MFDLGLVPGTVVEAELRSPAGDPTAYRIRGAMIALRRSQAELVSPSGDPTAYRIRGAMIALRREQAQLINIQRLTEAMA
jgi:Fe2+ transport system protein FeoA